MGENTQTTIMRKCFKPHNKRMQPDPRKLRLLRPLM